MNLWTSHTFMLLSSAGLFLLFSAPEVYARLGWDAHALCPRLVHASLFALTALAIAEAASATRT
jgi:hypothetical protein